MVRGLPLDIRPGDLCHLLPQTSGLGMYSPPQTLIFVPIKGPTHSHFNVFCVVLRLGPPSPRHQTRRPFGMNPLHLMVITGDLFKLVHLWTYPLGMTSGGGNWNWNLYEEDWSSLLGFEQVMWKLPHRCNVANEICTMYIEEFILVDIWMHCCTRNWTGWALEECWFIYTRNKGMRYVRITLRCTIDTGDWIELQLHENLSTMRTKLWSVIPLFASLITPGGVNGNLCRHFTHQTAGGTIEWHYCN